MVSLCAEFIVELPALELCTRSEGELVSRRDNAGRNEISVRGYTKNLQVETNLLYMYPRGLPFTLHRIARFLNITIFYENKNMLILHALISGRKVNVLSNENTKYSTCSQVTCLIHCASFHFSFYSRSFSEFL